jgi:DNA topoisomerase I
MSSNLVIVESPAKAKTIEKFLGKDFTVMSSFGHVRDLPKKNNAIDIENGFVPTYEVSADKKKVISQLKQAAKKSEVVWLASDEDREGEAIAWHLSEALGLQEDNTRRIVFHEITKTAILEAIKKPRTIDIDLVNGQQARRVLDRLVGFELSPVLWKKVRAGLSAGRVQSVAVRIVVEREREIDDFEAKSSFRLTANFVTEEGELLVARLPKDLPDLATTEQFLDAIRSSTFSVAKIEEKPGKRSPSPPFTTSTLQQTASSLLGFSVRQTMSLAQKLYEAGHITYMRTDSLTLSEQARGQIKDWVEGELGKNYYQSRHYKTKSALAQEAHEAIRPTSIKRRTVGGDANAKKLYELIWRRAVASQMCDAKTAKTTIAVEISGQEQQFVAKGEVITFPGFLEVMGYRKDDDGILPAVKVGDLLQCQLIQGREVFTKPPARFTEASLVRKLEELGIGRPSTYAPTITTIQNRGYVSKGESSGVERTVRIVQLEDDSVARADKTEMTGSNLGRLVPSDVAGIVTDFLVKHFPEVVDYHFTAKVEGQFDQIATGKLHWQDMLQEFYAPFHQDVEKAESVSRDEVSQARMLGIDPQTGKEVEVRLGRYGPFARLGDGDDVRFAGLKPEHKLDSVTLEEVLPLFELPRNLGMTKAGETMLANAGRFGPYVQFIHAKAAMKVEEAALKGVDIVPQNVSIDPEDPLTIISEQAEQFIQDKKAGDQKKEIKLFEGSSVQILDGRWGPFITDGLKNAKIPKDHEDPTSFSLEECQVLIEATKKEKKRLTKSYHGGGFRLIRNPKGVPDVTLKVKETAEKKVKPLVESMEAEGIKVRVISARGASEIRAAAKRKK